MQPSAADIQKGQAVYTPWMLSIYNLLVLRFSNRFIWRCSKQQQLEQFNQLVRRQHLDIGVGTGYYLEHCQWPPNTELSLMDLNPNCLEYCAQRLARLKPYRYQADIYQAQPALAERFDSISMNYLLHCLPGTLADKSKVIGNAAAMLKPGGLLFGATILSDPKNQSTAAKALSEFYNKKQIFSNLADTAEDLRTALSQHLEQVELKMVGSVALFKGYRSI